jgi:hypothetical protein
MQPVMSADASVMLMICRNGKGTVRITTSEGLALGGMPRTIGGCYNYVRCYYVSHSSLTAVTCYSLVVWGSVLDLNAISINQQRENTFVPRPNQGVNFGDTFHIQTPNTFDI